MAQDADDPRRESRHQRLDRNLGELLNELRVGLPGVQVLFGFLLVVPFNQRFGTVTGAQKAMYFLALLLAAASCVCLITPSMHHRLRFREQQKERIVLTGNRLAVAGLTLLALAIVDVLLFVTDYLFGTGAAVAVTAAFAALVAVLWYAVPMRGRRPEAAGDEDGPDGG